MLWWCRCFGGYPSSAWEFWTKTGLVTGGLYGSEVGKWNWKWTRLLRLNLNSTHTWQAADPTASLPVSITWMEPVHPARGRRRPPSVRRSALTVTPRPIQRTNSLVIAFSLILSAVSRLVSVTDAISPWFHLPQVNARTASPPSRSRSWLSCTRTDPWRQLSLYMQIFCSTRQVRTVQCLFNLSWIHIVMLNVAVGVYQHVTGEVLGGHAIKILGWGEENGTPYWLAANSWNGDWGDKGWRRKVS